MQHYTTESLPGDAALVLGQALDLLAQGLAHTITAVLDFGSSPEPDILHRRVRTQHVEPRAPARVLKMKNVR